jgi:hypothetical protein
MPKPVLQERLAKLKKEPLFKAVEPRVFKRAEPRLTYFNNKLFVLASRFGNRTYERVRKLLKNKSPEAKTVAFLMMEALGRNKARQFSEGALKFTGFRKGQVDLRDVMVALKQTREALTELTDNPTAPVKLANKYVSKTKLENIAPSKSLSISQ